MRDASRPRTEGGPRRGLPGHSGARQPDGRRQTTNDALRALPREGMPRTDPQQRSPNAWSGAALALSQFGPFRLQIDPVQAREVLAEDLALRLFGQLRVAALGH